MDCLNALVFSKGIYPLCITMPSRPKCLVRELFDIVHIGNILTFSQEKKALYLQN